jgi:hypothetical protein
MLSYQILKNILAIKNKSLVNYEKIMIEMLKKDYNIPVTVEKFISRMDDIDRCVALIREYKTKEMESQYQYDRKYLINNTDYLNMKNKIYNGIDLTNEEKQMKWIYDICVNTWNMSNNLKMDKYFFDEYVGDFRKSAVMIEKYFQMKRFLNMMEKSFDENQKQYKTKMEEIEINIDYNLDLYKTKKKTYFELLLEGQKLINILNPEKKECISRIDFDFKSTEYINTLTDENFQKIIKMNNLTKHNTYSNKVVLNNKKSVFLIKHILLNTFDLKIDFTKSRSKVYFNWEKWYDLQKKYNCNCNNNKLPSFSIVL